MNPLPTESAPSPWPTESTAPRSPRALAELRGQLRLFWELAKPGVTRLVLVTTALGVAATPESVPLSDWITAVVGTGLVVAGANALNMFLERDSDRFMTRTRTRPLPTGRLAPEDALAFGVGVSILGLGLLAQFVSMLAVGLAAFALLSYVLVYTPLKRVSSIALYVGAVPGALPPAIGYTAITGSFDRVAWCLFLILLVWQLPHFLAIALFREEEYGRAGLRVLSVERGALHTKKTIVFWSLALLLTTLLPWWLGRAGWGYAAIALVSGLAFSWGALKNLWAPDVSRARPLFFASMPHLVLVMGSLVVSLL